MAYINYNARLKNVQNRKFDGSINESLTSRLFNRSDIPDNIKYLLEITKPLGQEYNAKTLLAGERVKNHLERDFNLHFQRAYRHQGSVITNTNIKVHSDLDLLTIVDRYHYLGPSIPNDDPYTVTDPNRDIEELRKQSIEILKRQYDEVDTSGKKAFQFLINRFIGKLT